VRKQVLTELTITKCKSEEEHFLVWDAKQHGLALSVQPTGHKAFKVVYSFHGRPRWYDLGKASGIGLANARKLARDIQYRVAQGHDPQAERTAERRAGTFEELAERYCTEWSSKRNKSWKQGAGLVERYCLPRWAKLKPGDITRADVRALLATVEAPVLQNQILASASAVFSWAVKQEIIAANPCAKVDRNKVTSRERVLSDSELPRFWAEFNKAGLMGTALKLILLTGQRPGEITHMRREHVIDGWWEQPGAPDVKVGWPGTKNAQSHRCWLAAPVRKLIALDGDGFVLARPRRRPIEALDGVMRSICAALGIGVKATPHDLRRSFCSRVTGLGFGKDAMNRVTNHKEGGISSVYDRHGYGEENKRVMETVAAHILALAEGKEHGKVHVLGARKQR
jgi:integrase